MDGANCRLFQRVIGGSHLRIESDRQPATDAPLALIKGDNATTQGCGRLGNVSLRRRLRRRPSRGNTRMVCGHRRCDVLKS